MSFIKDRFLIFRSFVASAARPGIVTSLCENSGVNGMRIIIFVFKNCSYANGN